MLTESLQRIGSLQSLELGRSILVQKLIDREEASANLNLNLASLNFDHDFASSKLIDTFRLAHKHDLELLSVWVVVNILGQLLISLIVLHRNVNCNPLLHGQNVCLESLHVDLVSLLFFSQLLKHLKRQLVSLKASLLNLNDVVSRNLNLPLELLLVIQKRLILALQHGIFLNKKIDVRLLLIAHLFKRADLCGQL